MEVFILKKELFPG